MRDNELTALLFCTLSPFAAGAHAAAAHAPGAAAVGKLARNFPYGTPTADVIMALAPMID